jgi:phage-related protein (TIGR01555 family)
LSKVSIKRAAQKAITEDRRARQEQARRRTDDSFQNFALGLGIGTNNTSTANTYGFNPITRVRTELEWMYRGAWLAGSAVDVIANDMTREGVEITGQLDADEIEEIEEEAVTLRIWERINQTIKWSRLYGGCICVLLLDGQDYSTPLRVDRVGPNQFRGLLVLDRWMAMPSLEDLVTDIGPDLGLPKFYTVDVAAPALRGKRVHYSRCIRLIGDELPYWQAIAENMWGMSVLERSFPIVSQFDAATAGASQMVSKAYLRYFKVKKYRDILATGGPAKKGLQEMVAAMRLFASNEGISLIDAEDDMVTTQASVFSGMSEILLHLAEQIAGAFGIPLVRLLGQSPGGLGSNGEGEMKTYKDGIRQKQQHIRVGVTKIYRCLARSLGIDVEKGYIVKFRPLEQMTEPEKSEIAERDTRSAVAVMETGKISDKTFLQEVAHTSAMTGRWNSISKDVIDAASEELPDLSEMDAMPPPPRMGGEREGLGEEREPTSDKFGDAALCVGCESGDCLRHGGA